MNRDGISLQILAELYDRLVSMFEQSPEYGKLTMTVHMRDGIPQRFETSREESTLIKRGNK